MVYGYGRDWPFDSPQAEAAYYDELRTLPIGPCGNRLFEWKNEENHVSASLDEDGNCHCMAHVDWEWIRKTGEKAGGKWSVIMALPDTELLTDRQLLELGINFY